MYICVAHLYFVFYGTTKAIALLLEGKTALEVACQAMILLEDSPLTNAGYGSALNEDEEVECDAGIMFSEKDAAKPPRFGAVSGLKCVRNPILVAKEVVTYQMEPRLLGRVPPT